MDLPKYVLLDAGNSIKQLAELATDKDLPTIDVDAVMEIIVGNISERQTARIEMQFLGQCVLNIHDPEERRFNNLADDDEDGSLFFALETASLKINRVGREILDHVEQLKLFREGGYLQYEYHETIHDHTVVLRRKRGVLHGP